MSWSTLTFILLSDDKQDNSKKVQKMKEDKGCDKKKQQLKACDNEFLKSTEKTMISGNAFSNAPYDIREENNLSDKRSEIAAADSLQHAKSIIISDITLPAESLKEINDKLFSPSKVKISPSIGDEHCLTSGGEYKTNKLEPL